MAVFLLLHALFDQHLQAYFLLLSSVRCLCFISYLFQSVMTLSLNFQIGNVTFVLIGVNKIYMYTWPCVHVYLVLYTCTLRLVYTYVHKCNITNTEVQA